MKPKIALTKGDITEVKADAVANAANARLAPGGGVAGALHRAAGPALYEECKELAPIEVGECVITKGYSLPSNYVIHCLGPRYGIDKPEEKLLANCYKNALELADEKELKSIAFPAISTGAFGFPIEKAAPIALKTVKIYLSSRETSLEEVIFVLYSDKDLGIYKSTARDLNIKT